MVNNTQTETSSVPASTSCDLSINAWPRDIFPLPVTHPEVLLREISFASAEEKSVHEQHHTCLKGLRFCIIKEARLPQELLA